MGVSSFIFNESNSYPKIVTMIEIFQVLTYIFSNFYKRLPYLHALVGFVDMAFALARLVIYFSPSIDSSNSGQKQYVGRYAAALIVDWLSCIIPTLLGIFTIIIIFVILYKILAFCLNTWNRDKNREQIDTGGILRKLLRDKALRRLFIVDCNCPFYRARPKLRFQMRFGLIFAFFILRIVAISLYATAETSGGHGSLLASLCAISLIFIFATLTLDLYRYRVWWYYIPEGDKSLCGRSSKHERYLPYHMIGAKRDPRTLGDRPCTRNPCHERKLDHIVVFHGNDYQPQDRWRDIPKPPLIIYNKDNRPFCMDSREPSNQPHYIGFHTTEPSAAISIVKSEFRPGKNGWLGPGVYFARSVGGTIGKAKSEGGATIVAEMRMGKVYEVEREKIDTGNPRFDKSVYDYVHKGHWQKDYDTCYMIHPDAFRDEFAIKDAASQIVKWVVVIDEKFDTKVEAYGLDKEFETTRCGCI